MIASDGSNADETLRADQQSDPEPERERERLRALFQGLPEKYGARYVKLFQLRNLFLAEMASALQPSFDRWAAEKRSDPSLDRDAFARELTQDLHLLGLGIRSPDSPWPSYLNVVEVGRRHDLKYKIEALRYGPKRSDPRFDELPPLTLVADPPQPDDLSLLLQQSRPRSRGR